MSALLPRADQHLPGNRHTGRTKCGVDQYLFRVERMLLIKSLSGQFPISGQPGSIPPNLMRVSNNCSCSFPQSSTQKKPRLMTSAKGAPGFVFMNDASPPHVGKEDKGMLNHRTIICEGQVRWHSLKTVVNKREQSTAVTAPPAFTGVEPQH